MEKIQKTCLACRLADTLSYDCLEADGAHKVCNLDSVLQFHSTRFHEKKEKMCALHADLQAPFLMIVWRLVGRTKSATWIQSCKLPPKKELHKKRKKKRALHADLHPFSECVWQAGTVECLEHGQLTLQCSSKSAE